MDLIVEHGGPAPSLTHAWVPLPKGNKCVQEPIPGDWRNDVQVVARWKDGSPRMLHVWGLFDGPLHRLPALAEGEGDYQADVKAAIEEQGDAALAPFLGAPDIDWVAKAGFICERRSGEQRIHTTPVSRVISYSSAFRRVTLFTGEIRQFNAKAAGLPLVLGVTRTWVTQFSGHDRLHVDHSVTWTASMKDQRVTRVGFILADGDEVTQWAYEPGTDLHWHERPQWNGGKPLGEPLTEVELKELTGKLPPSWFQENKIGHYQFGDLHGTTIRDRWAVDRREGGSWDISPIPNPARPTHAWVQESGALMIGDCSNDDQVDVYIRHMAEGFNERAVPGRFTQGNPPRKWSAALNIPVAHRPGMGSYYCWGETLILEYARQGSLALLNDARLNADHLVQFGQCAAGWVPGVDSWHQLGAFWKNGEPVGPSTTTNQNTDWWSAHVGRSPDPFALWYAWLLDADYRAHWGFSCWAVTMSWDTITGAQNREGNKTLGIAADVVDWFDSDILAWRGADPAGFVSKARESVIRLTRAIMKKPLYVQSPGPLWDPLWVSKAVNALTGMEELAVADQLANFATVCRDTMHVSGHTRLLDTEAMDLSCVSQDLGLMHQHLPWVAHQARRAGGVGPGPLGDAFLARQWGWFKQSIRQAMCKANVPTRLWDWKIPVGNVSFGDMGGVVRRGTRVTFEVETSDLAPDGSYRLVLGGMGTGGDPHPCTLIVRQRELQVWTGQWRPQGATFDPSFGGYVNTYVIPGMLPGLYDLHIGGHALELLPWRGVTEVRMPPGTYIVRGDERRFPFESKPDAAPSVIEVKGDSAESWVAVEHAGDPDETRLELGDALVVPVGDIVLVGGQDPRAILRTVADVYMHPPHDLAIWHPETHWYTRVRP